MGALGTQKSNMSSVALRLAKIPNFIDFFALEVLLFGDGFICDSFRKNLPKASNNKGKLSKV